MNKKSMLIPLGALLTAITFATPASAAAPLQFRSHIDATISEPDLSAACGFEIVAHLEGTDHVSVWFDESGAVTKVTETTPGFFHTFTNVATGASYTTVTPASVHITSQGDGTFLFVVDGLWGHILGGDTRSLRGGHWEWVAELVGPGDIEPVGDPIFVAGPTDSIVPALCGALA